MVIDDLPVGTFFYWRIEEYFWICEKLKIGSSHLCISRPDFCSYSKKGHSPNGSHVVFLPDDIYEEYQEYICVAPYKWLSDLNEYITLYKLSHFKDLTSVIDQHCREKYDH